MINNEQIERGIDHFFDYARERYLIFLRRRSGQRPPWTEDPILATNRFCNVFREDDKTTVWFRENVREPQRDRPQVIFSTVAFRWFNRISTGDALLRAGLFDQWDERAARGTLQMLRSAGHPVVTGAYVIKSPTGMDKIDGLLWCIRQVEDAMGRLPRELEGRTLQQIHTRLMGFPFLGSFMGYEITTDLRHTQYGEYASDIGDWAAVGPGAARGLSRIFRGNVGSFRYTSRADQQLMLGLMQELRIRSLDERLWPQHWPQWEMREVESTLCEVDKWIRAQEGGRMKQRYNAFKASTL